MNAMEVFFLIIFAVSGIIGVRMVFKRGLVGSMMGGKLEKTYGEVCFSSHAMVTHTFKVHRLIKKSQPTIALEYRQRTFGGGKIIPLQLSKSEATKLSELLRQAANEI